MLRKISIAVVILALLFIPLFAFAQSETSDSPRLMGVHFDSQPGYAEVRVDGAFIGTTPLPYRLRPGVHKIEMTRRGFDTWTRELLVSTDSPTNVTAVLDGRDAKPCGK